VNTNNSFNNLLHFEGVSSVVGTSRSMAATTAEMPILKPGALIICGVVKKQPHGLFGGIRGKQTRWMELKIGADSIPELLYYEHPKTAQSQVKGVVYLDSSVINTVKADRAYELHISGASHAVGGGRGAAGERDDAKVVGDFLLEFQSVEVCAKWEAAFRYAVSGLASSVSGKRQQHNDSYKNYSDISQRRVVVVAATDSIREAVAEAKASAASLAPAPPAPDSHPEATRAIHDLIRASGLKARDAHPEATRAVYDLIKASALKAVDKHPVATRTILDLIFHPKPRDPVVHAVMRLTVDDKDLKEFKDVVLLMETATRAEEGCAASPSCFLHH
jgi:hypothetical protein